MRPLFRSMLPLAVSAALILPAHAADTPHVTFSGFGTAALTRTNTDLAEFARTNQAGGARKNFETGVDSNLGLQATVKVNEWLSATGQGLVRKYITDHYSGELTWAFVKLKSSDELSFRLGRLGLPIYMVSDYRNVGYAQPMLRPPIELYGQVPIDHIDGGDVTYQRSFGDTSVTAELVLGRVETDISDGTRLHGRRVAALHVVAEHGPLTLRFGHSIGRFSADNAPSLEQLVGALQLFGFSSEAQQLQIANFHGKFTSLGLVFDWRNMILQAEYAKRNTTTYTFPDTTSWYAMAGYRIGKVTPYLSYAKTTQDSPREFSTLPPAGPLTPLALGANSAIKAGLQSTLAAGVRWDFHRSAALKVQIDRVRPSSGNGTFINAVSGIKGPVTVFAAGIDFVF